MEKRQGRFREDYKLPEEYTKEEIEETIGGLLDGILYEKKRLVNAIYLFAAMTITMGMGAIISYALIEKTINGLETKIERLEDNHQEAYQLMTQGVYDSAKYQEAMRVLATELVNQEKTIPPK